MSNQTKGIEFKVSIDAKEANKQIQEIQKRLQEMTKNQSYQDRTKSQAGGADKQDERLNKIFKERNEQQLAAGRENLLLSQKLLDSKQKLLDKVTALAKAESISENERMTALDKKKKIEEDLYNIAVKTREQKDAIADGEALGKPGGTGDGGPAGRLAQVGSMLKNAVPYIAAAAGVAKFLGEQTRFQQNKAGVQADIAQGMFKASGSDLLMSGRGAEFAVYQKERARGMENARITQTGMTTREAGGTIQSAAIGGMSAAAGMAIGGKLGLPLGPFGVAGGAAIGAGIGAVAGNVRNGGQLAGGISSFMQGDTFEAGVQRARDLEYARDASRNADVERAKDPFKEKAMESMISKNDARQNIMRKSGLSYGQLTGTQAAAPTVDMQGNFTFGEYTPGVLGSGQYTEQKTMSVMEQIASAGGTSAQIGSPRGAQDLQRNYGVESAPQILGALSGKLMGGQKSFGPDDEVTKRMLAGAFSAGIDTSKMGAETEKFLQASTKFVMESGAKTEGGMAAVAGGLANFMPEGSMAGIDVAVSAKEQFNKLGGGEGPAYQQNLRLNSLRKKFPQMDENDLFYVSKMNPDEVTAGDDTNFKRILERNGISHADFKRGSAQSTEKSMTYDTGNEKKMTELRGLVKERSEGGLMMKGIYDKKISDVSSDLGVSGFRMNLTGGLKGEKAQALYEGIASEAEGIDPTTGIKAPIRAKEFTDMLEITNGKTDQVRLEREGKYQKGAEEDFGEYLNKSNKELMQFAENLEKINAQANNPNKGFNPINAIIGGSEGFPRELSKLFGTEEAFEAGLERDKNNQVKSKQ